MNIQNAVKAYQAHLPFVNSAKGVQGSAAADNSLHTSILQGLEVLSQAADDFGVTGVSEGFQVKETK